MKQEQVENFKVWFNKYVAGFYGDDEFINTNLKLKENHSQRTCEEILYLASELGLSDNQRRIAEATALFHDIGRFEQFVKYRTYNDSRSVNHCLLGIEALRKTKALEEVPSEERQWIEKAIEYHGQKELPDYLKGQCLLFSRLIRDADKMDIFYVVVTYNRQYRDNPEKFALELELPDEPGYSADIIESILCGQRIDYRQMRTLNDMKLCQLAWVYDVNFTAALKRIKQRKFLDELFCFLPDTSDIERVREKVFAYVEFRMEQERGKNKKQR